MGAEQTTLLDSEGAHGDVGFDFLVSQMETELEPERKDASERAARTIQFHVRRRSMQIRKEAARIEKEEAVAGVADRGDATGVMSGGVGGLGWPRAGSRSVQRSISVQPARSHFSGSRAGGPLEV